MNRQVAKRTDFHFGLLELDDLMMEVMKYRSKKRDSMSKVSAINFKMPPSSNGLPKDCAKAKSFNNIFML